MSPTTHAEKISDLATLAGMLEVRVHADLAMAVDVDGRPRVVLAPDVAGEIHLLAREIARRTRELQEIDDDRH